MKRRWAGMLVPWILWGCGGGGSPGDRLPGADLPSGEVRGDPGWEDGSGTRDEGDGGPEAGDPGNDPGDGQADGPEDPGNEGTADGGGEPCPPGPGPGTGPIRGFILLDPDDAAVEASIEAAARFGVGQIQLSHDLIMDLDEIVGDGSEVEARVARLNRAISLAHGRAMKVFVWHHEFPAGVIPVCYGPEGDIWRQREAVWRTALGRIPDVDGVVLMFGSAGTPPWFTICDCEWCWDRWGQEFDSPPQAERLRLVTERMGRVVVREMGKELIARVFVHEPEENAWHREGFGAVRCLPMVSMHKDSVNDWQPYNPFDPTMPVSDRVPGLMETDAAGEYFGQSVLPFAAPGYFRWRLAQAAERGGIGWAARIERGTRHALGTPNEVNLWALKMFSEDPATSLEAVWDQAFRSLYGIPPGSEASRVLQGILETTLPIRLKSHYALGIWALEKGSDIPSRPEFGEFFNRGDMRKWDPDWTGVWESLDRPDRRTVIRLWQEGTEAVVLAREALQAFLDRRGDLEGAGMGAGDLRDLERRLRHQAHGAVAWRAVDLFLWSARALGRGVADPDLPAFEAFAVQELRQVADGMEADGLGDVVLVSPDRVRRFADAAAQGVPGGVEPRAPPGPWISPLRVVEARPTGATLAFTVQAAGDATIQWGTEMPDFEGPELALGLLEAGSDHRVDLEGLPPGSRVVARLRLVTAEGEFLGGETWVFTPFP